MTQPNIVYNEKWDEQNGYAITDWHRSVVSAIQQHFNLPDNTKWVHFATIHGRSFNTKALDKNGQPMLRRLHLDDLIFLAAIPGFRWVEWSGDDVCFALTHKEPPKAA